MFALSPSGGVQLGSKLTATVESGQGAFGYSVAVIPGSPPSGIIGAPLDSNGQGAAWYFSQASPSSTWAQSTRLNPTASTGNDGFGNKVASSSDVSVVSAPGSNSGSGAVWVFRNDTAQLLSISPTGGFFGGAVAISGDSSRILVGAPALNGGAGSASVFAASGSGKFALVTTLTASDEVGLGLFGSAVGLDKNGAVAIVGGPVDNHTAGGAWYFAPSPSGSTSTSTTTSSSASTSTTTTTTTTTATNTAATSTASTSTVTTTIASTTTASTSTASTTTATATGHAAASASGVSPSTGVKTGGTTVTVTGSGFTGATAVTFGTSAGTLVSVDSDTQITAVSPASASTGAVNVRVIGPGGTSLKNAGDLFTYTKAPPPGSSTTTNTASTSTTTTTTTTPGSTTTKTTTTKTTTTPSKTPPKHPVARIVRIKVKPVKGVRTLVLRIRVSEQASAKVVLRVPGSPPLLGTFPVQGGGNTIVEPLPKWVHAGSGQVVVVLTDRSARTGKVTTSVTVPA